MNAAVYILCILLACLISIVDAAAAKNPSPLAAPSHIDEEPFADDWEADLDEFLGNDAIVLEGELTLLEAHDTVTTVTASISMRVGGATCALTNHGRGADSTRNDASPRAQTVLLETGMPPHGFRAGGGHGFAAKSQQAQAAFRVDHVIEKQPTPRGADSGSCPNSLFHVKEMIGKGGFGEAYLCGTATDERGGGERNYVLKYVKDTKELDHEFEIGRRFLGAPHVAQIHGKFQGKRRNDPRNKVYNFLLSDHYDHGDMEKWLKSQGWVGGQCNVSLETRRRLFRESLIGLQEVHNRNIIHMDIKSSNIFIKNRPDGQPEAYVADFGTCQAVQEAPKRAGRRASYVLGPGMKSPGCSVPIAFTLGYLPPEVLGFNTFYVPISSADMWAMGMTAMSLFYPGYEWTRFFTDLQLTNQRLMKTQPRTSLAKTYVNQVLDKALQGPPMLAAKSRARMTVGGWSLERQRDLQELILSMINPDETKRPTASQALAHPFFAGGVPPSSQPSPAEVTPPVVVRAANKADRPAVPPVPADSPPPMAAPIHRKPVAQVNQFTPVQRRTPAEILKRRADLQNKDATPPTPAQLGGGVHRRPGINGLETPAGGNPEHAKGGVTARIVADLMPRQLQKHIGKAPDDHLQNLHARVAGVQEKGKRIDVLRAGQKKQLADLNKDNARAGQAEREKVELERRKAERERAERDRQRKAAVERHENAQAERNRLEKEQKDLEEKRSALAKKKKEAEAQEVEMKKQAALAKAKAENERRKKEIEQQKRDLAEREKRIRDQDKARQDAEKAKKAWEDRINQLKKEYKVKDDVQRRKEREVQFHEQRRKEREAEVDRRLLKGLDKYDSATPHQPRHKIGDLMNRAAKEPVQPHSNIEKTVPRHEPVATQGGVDGHAAAGKQHHDGVEATMIYHPNGVGASSVQTALEKPQRAVQILNKFDDHQGQRPNDEIAETAQKDPVQRKRPQEQEDDISMKAKAVASMERRKAAFVKERQQGDKHSVHEKAKKAEPEAKKPSAHHEDVEALLARVRKQLNVEKVPNDESARRGEAIAGDLDVNKHQKAKASRDPKNDADAVASMRRRRKAFDKERKDGQGSAASDGKASKVEKTAAEEAMDRAKAEQEAKLKRQKAIEARVNAEKKAVLEAQRPVARHKHAWVDEGRKPEIDNIVNKYAGAAAVERRPNYVDEKHFHDNDVEHWTTPERRQIQQQAEQDMQKWIEKQDAQEDDKVRSALGGSQGLNAPVNEVKINIKKGLRGIPGLGTITEEQQAESGDDKSADSKVSPCKVSCAVEFEKWISHVQSFRTNVADREALLTCLGKSDLVHGARVVGLQLREQHKAIVSRCPEVEKILESKGIPLTTSPGAAGS